MIPTFILFSCFEANPASKVNITLSGVTVCCQEVSQHTVNTVSLYIKWDVQSVRDQWIALQFPIAFVVEVRANVSHGLTSWKSFSVSGLIV